VAPNAKRDGRAELAEVERVFKALAHPARRQILLVLQHRGGEMTSGEIAARFACAWPTVTRHLRLLREAGLVGVRERGRERGYVLERATLLRVAGGWLDWFQREGTR
jgi:DNA-binding transcriptional ArsR family regulator